MEFVRVLKRDFVQPVARFTDILKFDPGQARDPKGTHTGGRFAKENRSAIDQKRRDFMALIKRSDREEGHLNRMRVGTADAWKVWVADIQNRKKPLKPDGAAAKKLESYKHAKTLETAFHAQYDISMAKSRALEAQAKEMLKVPVDQRSKLTFKDDPQAPLGPFVVARAQKALETFRQFDGSGAFEAVKFPADKLDDIKKIFGGENPFVQNADGTYSIPTKLTLGKTEGRAHATPFGIHVVSRMGASDMEGQVFHEVAHHIEMNRSEVKKAAIAFRESMANQPREVYKLKDVSPGLRDDELAVRGKFPDPYVGKIYPDDISTEVVSTGVESYLRNPVSFARDRPEHFNFIFDVMHGKYRSTE